MNLRLVGLLLRDREQTFPEEDLRKLLQAEGARLVIVQDRLPQEPLDLLIAMGGDGTVLKALHMHPPCAVLAVNYGTVGFLTAGDRTDLRKLLQRLLAGEYLISQRMLLHCKYPSGTTMVINEAVLRSSWRIASVDLSINERPIRRIRGDGVIIGTPTGSTGYLLSTGAPIVMPDAECYVLDGINEYNFRSRALILSATARVHLRVQELFAGQEMRLYIDGSPTCTLKTGDEIHLERAQETARLIFLNPGYFFHNLRTRLDWF